MAIKKLMLLTSVVGILATSTAVFADEGKARGSGPNPFTDCGIGAALFKDTKWAALTSNVIWDVGTTAVISATASPQTCNAQKVMAALFIRDAYSNLAEETASGRGEHLVTALNIFGCGKSHHESAVRQIRSAMGRIVASPDYVEQLHIDKAASFYSVIENAVVDTCSA